MNQDFHYEGTFCAALDAGFSVTSASVIAHAAQMVDDCTTDYLHSLGKLTYDSVPTMESDGDNLKNLSADFRTPDSPALQKTRRVWIPFHFLPGNLNLFFSYPDSEMDSIKRLGFSENRDVLDLKLLCLPCSELAQQMVEDTRDVYAQADLSYASPYSPMWMRVLSLIGVRMHVLADTWAHKYFAGTPSKWINNATEFSKIEGRPSGISELGSLDTDNVYSVYFLGHARAGHYPDYGSLTYQYRAPWLLKNKLLIKQNWRDFLCAYIQMVHAMTFIRTKCTDSFSCGSTDGLLSDFYQLPNAAKIQETIKVPKADQTEEWRRRLPISSLPKYRKEDVDIDAFQAAAKSQLYLVKNYLEGQDICYL